MTLGPSPQHARLRAAAPTLPYRLINRVAALLDGADVPTDVRLIAAETLEDAADEARFWAYAGARADGLAALARELRAAVPTTTLTLERI